MGVLKSDCVYHATRRPKITSGFKIIWRRNPRKSVRRIQPGSRWNLASSMKIEPNSSSHPAKTIIFEITRCMSTLAPMKDLSLAQRMWERYHIISLLWGHLKTTGASQTWELIVMVLLVLRKRDRCASLFEYRKWLTPELFREPCREIW